MANSMMYTASVPVFTQLLGGLSAVLAKGQAHAQAKNIDPIAKGVCARLAGVDVPAMKDEESSFEELQARIKAVQTFIGQIDPALFEKAASREIVTQAGTPKEKRFTGESYLFNYGLPHFFFHTTTAYSLLRHGGVEVGKKDYIGAF
jgi:uncharacterized protein